MRRSKNRPSALECRQPTAQLKQALLHQAARLVARPPGLPAHDALRKAAIELGLDSRDIRIESTELADAVRDYRALFHQDAELDLRAQRNTALEALRFFASFNPRLVGAVLEGTTSGSEAIQIQLFTDDEDSVAHRLDEHGMAYEHAASFTYELPPDRLRVPSLSLLAGGTEVRLMILPERLLRQSLRRAGQLQVERRADAIELARMLDTK